MSLILPPQWSPSEGADPLLTSLQLLRVAEDVVRAFEIHARGRFGLSSTRLGVLLWLERSETAGRQPGDLAERLRVSRATVSRLLDGLAADGLVARRPDPRDGRARRIVLTRRGRMLAREIVPTHAARLSALTRCLDEEEREQLSHLLEKIRAGLRTLQSP